MAVRACMVTPNLSLGGAERWLTDLIVHSPPDRLQWTGVALSGHGGTNPTLVAALRQVCPIYANNPFKVRPPHANEFCTDGVQIVGRDFFTAVNHAAKGAEVIVTWGGPDMGQWLEWFGGPRVLTSHTTMKSDRSRQQSIAGVTHLAAVSQAADQYFKQFEGHDEYPHEVILNGVHPDRCIGQPTKKEARRRIRNQWKIPWNAEVVGYMGRQTSEKNYMAAARAVCSLVGCRSKRPPIYAVYYGADAAGKECSGQLQLWCESYIPDRYRLYAPVSDVSDALSGMDALVLASEREACSLTLIEAWIAGVPVVATPVGAIPELEEKYGTLVTRISVGAEDDELAGKVQFALRSKQARKTAELAQKVARGDLTVSKMVDRWAEYLTRIVSEA